MSVWINFKQLRAKLDFEQVLQHYGVDVHRKGKQHLGFCPLPKHQGKRNSPSFSANLERGIFQCFGCGASGNVLEFAALMEKVAINDGQALRMIAVKLQNRFCPAQADGAAAKKVLPDRNLQQREPRSKTPVLVNAPLDFELKGLEPGHPYLLNRGFSPETIDHFGLGFCSRGTMKGRVAIPLHEQKGRLIGYAGRLVDDAAIDENEPKYRFPASRVREGKTYEFRKARFVYNGFRINAPVDDLIVVEGFPSVWWLTQIGFPNTLAVMGSDCSEKQAELIVALTKPASRVWIIPDGDAAGERCAASVLAQVAAHRFVRWIKLEPDKQPTDYVGSFYQDRLRS